jgi:hypothetical protein
MTNQEGVPRAGLVSVDHHARDVCLCPTVNGEVPVRFALRIEVDPPSQLMIGFGVIRQSTPPVPDRIPPMDEQPQGH